MIAHTSRFVHASRVRPSRAREAGARPLPRRGAAGTGDATLETFPHPRYELIAQMTVHDGDEEVRGYYADTRIAFPDQDHEPHRAAAQAWTR